MRIFLCECVFLRNIGKKGYETYTGDGSYAQTDKRLKNVVPYNKKPGGKGDISFISGLSKLDAVLP